MLVTIEISCPFCGCVHFVDVIEEDYFRWLDGGFPRQATLQGSDHRRADLDGGKPEL